MAKLTVYGTGGNARTVTKLGVYGSGGVLRNVKAAWVYGTNGVPRKFFGTAAGFSIVAADVLGVSKGYENLGIIYGSISPNPGYGPGGGVVYQFLTSNGSNILRLSLGGFSSNPGQNLFSTITVSSIGAISTASATYSWQNVASNTATWDFVTAQKFIVGGNYSATFA